MKARLPLAVSFLVLSVQGCSRPNEIAPTPSTSAPPTPPAELRAASPSTASPKSPAARSPKEPDIPAGLNCLAKLYGGKPVYKEPHWMLAFDEDHTLLFDDGLAKSEEEKLASPDLEDTLATPYPARVAPEYEERAADPGRTRHMGLLKQIYGASRKQVEAELVKVSFLGHPIQVHRFAEAAFKRVAHRIDQLGPLSGDEKSVLANLGGTFNHRTIDGTDRLSPHAFGIAIDLNPARAAYFRWSSKWDGEYPVRIVDAFESEGFIWGGRWAHFDSMHFEYRPELFPERCGE